MSSSASFPSRSFDGGLGRLNVRDMDSSLRLVLIASWLADPIEVAEEPLSDDFPSDGDLVSSWRNSSLGLDGVAIGSVRDILSLLDSRAGGIPSSALLDLRGEKDELARSLPRVSPRGRIILSRVTVFTGLLALDLNNLNILTQLLRFTRKDIAIYF